MPSPRPAGLTLVEILVVLTVVGILAAAAVPRLDRYVQAIRVRGALDLVVAEVYHARMLAVRTGRPVQLVLGSNAAGCIERFRLRLGPPDGRATTVVLQAAPVCLRHNGDSILHYNGRGMLRPPGRSVFSSPPEAVDSAVLSIAGRVRRSYRRGEKNAGRGKRFRPPPLPDPHKSFVFNGICGGTEVPSGTADALAQDFALECRILHDRAADGARHRRHYCVHGHAAPRRLRE